MKKKTWLLAILVGFSATLSACSDDAGKEQKVPVDEMLTYSMACTSASNCTLDLETGSTGLVMVQLKSKNAQNVESIVPNTMITATSQNTVITMQEMSSSLTLTTDASGYVAVQVTAGQAAGVGSIEFKAADPRVNAEPVTFTINVTAKAVTPVEPPPAVDKDVAYKFKAEYNGSKTIAAAEAIMFAGKTCAEIAPTGMTSEDVMAITPDNSALSTTKLIDGSISDKEFIINTTESAETVYAVVVRAKESKNYIAYGCIDDISQKRTEAVIPLDDTFIESDPDNPIVGPDKPVNPDTPVDPGEDPKYTTAYGGNYTLRSQFNALTLLPHADVPNGSVPLFKEMLLGDWIEFALDILSDPEKEIPLIISEQLLPLLLDAEWLQNLIAKIAPGLESAITPELVQTLFETLGVNAILTDLLKQLTGQLDWWDTATSIVTIVNNLATNLTLEGQFIVPASTPDDKGNISGIGHLYNTLLYNNGAFETCVIGDETGEKDADGNKICSIKLSDLDKGSASVRGTFTANFSNPEERQDVSVMMTGDVLSHSLQLAYGKLIYAALIETFPLFVKPADGSPVPDTLGKLLEYYVGMGLAKLWNKDPAHAENQITTTNCTAVGTYLYRIISEKMESLKPFLDTFGEASLTALCTMGVSTLDKTIDNQLNKLSASSEKVSFTSAGCPLSYVTDDTKHVHQLVMFGKDHTWGSNVDKRCIWDMSITTTNDEGVTKVNKIKGKFWAERERD